MLLEQEEKKGFRIIVVTLLKSCQPFVALHLFSAFHNIQCFKLNTYEGTFFGPLYPKSK